MSLSRNTVVPISRLTALNERSRMVADTLTKEQQSTQWPEQCHYMSITMTQRMFTFITADVINKMYLSVR